MKILMVHDLGYRYGGGEIYLLNIRKALEQRGHTVRIFTSDYNPTGESLFADDVAPTGEGSLFRMRRIWNRKAKSRLAEVCASFRPDVVHVHSVFYHLSGMALRALRKYPTILTVHNYFMFCGTGLKYYPDYEICTHTFGMVCVRKGCIPFKEYLFQLVLRHVLRRDLKNVNLFVPCSSYGASLLKQNHYSKFYMLNHGIDLTGYASNPLPKDKNLLYFGRLVREKGVDYLIRGMPKVLERFPEYRLQIIGDGPERRNLAELAKSLGVGSKVRLLGHLQNERIKRYIQRSRIVYVPSIWPDNSPITIYETLACGKAIIASRVGGIPDLVHDGKNGFLVDRNDSDAIAEKTVALLRDPALLKRFGEHSRKLAEEEFEIGVHIGKLVSLYCQVIEGIRTPVVR
ncbi:glycosyltransferase family 4 protein [Candidatus Woesearchaeota archaeon]|nr:glycosyltransferase family 4 protein [Candidatus Woesearchaeota archaeon]